MSVAIEDRPTETVREEVIDQLIMNYSHSEISYQAFEKRLDKAMETDNNAELKALVEDLPLKADTQYQQSKQQDFGVNFIPGETEDVDTLVSIFGGSDRKGRWKVAKEIRSLNIFGGSDLDLSEAIFTQREVRIKIFCLFGGVNINVPENVNVVSKAFGIFGGVSNSAPSDADISAPIIIIEGVAIFSGINVKIKRTMKERFVAFADSLKKMFA